MDSEGSEVGSGSEVGEADATKGDVGDMDNKERLGTVVERACELLELELLGEIITLEAD